MSCRLLLLNPEDTVLLLEGIGNGATKSDPSRSENAASNKDFGSYERMRTRI